MIWHSVLCLHNELLNYEFRLFVISIRNYLPDCPDFDHRFHVMLYLILNYSAPLHLGHGYTALRSTETVIQVQVWDEHLSVFADTMQLFWCK